ncbi:MAG: superoxide dismutase family protein [Eubacteriales bacterium]
MAGRSFMASQLSELFRRNPDAYALILGSPEYNRISGRAEFWQTQNGVVVVTYLTGLPFLPGRCSENILAFHIHDGKGCAGDTDDPFKDAGSHYNPYGCPHPAHAGDMPPLFVAGGYAFLVFLTDRFKLTEVIGLPVVVHESKDDFTTQPSGGAGKKIACGVIKK